MSDDTKGNLVGTLTVCGFTAGLFMLVYLWGPAAVVAIGVVGLVLQLRWTL